jgi:hypothetical protein
MFCSASYYQKTNNTFTQNDVKAVINNGDFKRVYQMGFERNEEMSEELMGSICEEMYRTFNIEHPEDYRGRSMSVGDLVRIMYFDEERGFKVAAFFSCQSFGFERVTMLVEDITF